MPRRWPLPLALWLLFALTLALALGVREYIRAGRRVILEPQARQGMRLNAPAGWASRQVGNALLFEEPAPRGKGRRLEIGHAQANAFLSPLDYLVRSGELPARDAAALLAAADQGDAQLKPLPIAGWPGILIAQTRLLRAQGAARAVPWKQSLACAVLPGGAAIVLRLEGEGLADEQDEQLLRDIAAGIELTARSTRPATGDLALEDDIRIAIPGGWAAAASADPFRLAATLAPPPAADYLAVEVVPCILPPGDPAAALAGMVLLRDPRFVPGPVRNLDDRTFACDRADPVAPASAFLRVDGHGRALLAEFRWHPSPSPDADRQRIDAAWNAIQAGIAFDGDSPVPAMLDAGRDELARLPSDPVDWLEGAPLEHWQWYDDASPRLGRTVRRWTVDREWVAADEVTENSPASPGAWIVRQWRLRRDGAVYEHSLRRGGGGGVMAQQAHLAEGTLRIALFDAAASIAQGTGEAPELFVPGGLLPLAVGRIGFKPILLRAESILWPGEPASPQPMTLILEPSFDVPRLPAPGQEPMRCWRIRISGRSDCARWYLDPSNRLQAVHYAAGVQAQRVELPPARPSTRPSTRPVTAPPSGPESRPAAH